MHHHGVHLVGRQKNIFRILLDDFSHADQHLAAIGPGGQGRLTAFGKQGAILHINIALGIRRRSDKKGYFNRRQAIAQAFTGRLGQALPHARHHHRAVTDPGIEKSAQTGIALQRELPPDLALHQQALDALWHGMQLDLLFLAQPQHGFDGFQVAADKPGHQPRMPAEFLDSPRDLAAAALGADNDMGQVPGMTGFPEKAFDGPEPDRRPGVGGHAAGKNHGLVRDHPHGLHGGHEFGVVDMVGFVVQIPALPGQPPFEYMLQ